MFTLLKFIFVANKSKNSADLLLLMVYQSIGQKWEVKLMDDLTDNHH